MPQTPETRIALERDNYLCMWCYYKHGRKRGVFAGPMGRSALGGGHHIFGRARVDKAEAIIGLCSECHSLAESHKISRCDLISLLEFITQNANLHTEYAQFHKCYDVQPWGVIAGYEAPMTEIKKIRLSDIKVIVKLDDNYADEFDVEGFKVMPEWKWNLAKDILDSSAPEYFEWHFGTNEFVSWDSGKAFTNGCKAQRISQEEFGLLKKLFGNGQDEFSYGMFPDYQGFAVFDDLDDEPSWDGPEPEGFDAVVIK